MTRAIDANALIEELLCDFTGKPYNGNRKFTVSWIRRYINHAPTIETSLTCEGCIHEHEEHENCNYCQRAPYLGDYYYRRPPEGEA